MSQPEFPMSSSPTYAGTGLYPISDAARLLHMKPGKLRNWVREYEYTSRGQTYAHHSLVKRQFEADEQLLTFLELMELQFVKLFRSEGVSMQTIRKAAEIAAEKFDTDYPFAVQRFDTDGRSIFATLKAAQKNTTVIEELKHGQLVFKEIVRPFFRKLEYDGQNIARRYWPMEQKGRIVLDPERHFGKPIDAETGVPTIAIYQAISAGDGQNAQAVAKWFDIPIKAVNAAIRFEQSLAL